MSQAMNGEREHGRERYTVAIVGGGFTGAVLAAQILRKAGGRVSVVVIERSHAAARGVAYSTPYDCHLLNVPAGKMTAFPDDIEHFLRWARAHYDPKMQSGDFAPRRVYGQYIESILVDQAKASHPGQLQWLQDEAVSISGHGPATIQLRSGRMIAAEKVVLALGNFPPSDPSLPGKRKDSTRYVSYSWDSAGLAEVNSDRAILLVGSGLTSVDLALALRGRNFNGVIHVISRRGLLPRRHRTVKPWPAFWNETSPCTALGMLRLVRAHAEMAKKQGSDWRAVIDSLRPFTQKMWASLPFDEKRRFLRHVRPYWEVHRHRVAPEIGDFIGEQVRDCHLQVHAGRIMQYREDETGVDVTYFDRSLRKESTLRVDRVINCTGPEADYRRVNDPLLNHLFSAGLARPDALFQGLDVSENGALLDALGQPSNFLYTVGPARKGQLWETTAVPELRVQVAELATRLLEVKVGPQRTASGLLPLLQQG